MYNEVDQGFLDQARDEAIAWARGVLANQDDYLILDTETTGLGLGAEVVQIGIIDLQGRAIVDTLVKPMGAIPHDATAIHGITNAMVAKFATYDKLFQFLFDQVRGKTLISYNAAFDSRMLAQSRGEFTPSLAAAWECAMENYAKYYGEWNSRLESFKWQRLQGGDHSALGDCRATLRLIRGMAEARLLTE